MYHFKEHFVTITNHKIKVMQNCFRVGLYRQGLLHDLSKYSPVEFLNGAKYFQGDKSPNAGERDDKGFSEAWLHHKGRNRHHWEYWTDYVKEENRITGVPMPLEYIIEMVCDRVAASKVYKKENYTDSSALEYYNLTRKYYLIHPETDKLLKKLLTMLAVNGEEYTFRYMRHLLAKKRRENVTALAKKAGIAVIWWDTPEEERM